jgi:hypothetical protein
VEDHDRFSLTPGMRYDWQNFLAKDRLSFSPAPVVCLGARIRIRSWWCGAAGGVLRPVWRRDRWLDLARYEPRGVERQPLRRSVSLSLRSG